MRHQPISVLFFATVGCSMFLAPSASADPIALAPHERTVTLANGQALTVGNRDESATTLPPVGTIREIEVSSTAYVQTGDQVGDAVLKTGYHVACAVDIGRLGPNVGGDLGIAPGVTIAPGTGGVPDLTGTIGPSAGLSGSVSLEINPGDVKDVALGEKKLDGPRAAITNRGVRIQIDKCVAPVTVRSYTIVKVQSPEVDDSIAVYGDPVTM